MRVYFSHTSKSLPIAKFAIARDGERPIEAIRRSIERTTGKLGYTCRLDSWTQDRKGRVIGQTYAMTLVERKPFRDGSYSVAAEIRVYVTIEATS